MTTHSDISQQPYWFTRPAAEARASAASRPENWAMVPGFTRYEWSDKGGLRRARDGYVMKTGKVNNSGYVVLGVVRDSDGKQVTVPLAAMVLLAHHPAFAGLGAFPAGLESRHNPQVADKRFNAYPEGLWPGTSRQNEADKDREPRFTCRNAPRCPAMVAHEGRRCAACAAEVGRQAAALLDEGMALADVAAVFGYTRGDWTWRLAVRYGGYQGTREQAAGQRPTMAARVRLRFRRRVILAAAAARGGDPS